MTSSDTKTEQELEAFRQQWRQEVSSRTSRPGQTSSGASRKVAAPAPAPAPITVTAKAGASIPLRKDAADYSEELEPKAYHDLPDKEEALKLGTEGQNHDRDAFREPRSALEHYERAVEKEAQGQLGDSMKHYRTAFKLDDGVHEAYKRKHFPSKPSKPNPPGSSSIASSTAQQATQSNFPPTTKQLAEAFASLTIDPPPPPTDASPPQRCRLGELPEEILSQIMVEVAIRDVASFARLSQVCKRLAYLVLTEEPIWRRVAEGQEFGFGAMQYDYSTDVEGMPLEANENIARYLEDVEDEEEDVEASPSSETLTSTALNERLLTSVYGGSWRQMFRARPRIRFNGCYISTVNYTRPGASSTNSLTWGTPVHVVTYFRYLRFFRDGTAISLRTTSEPVDVVHHLIKANLHDHHGNTLPSSVMKDALRGRWRLSGSLSSVKGAAGEDEAEGDVHIETEGVVSKYTYRLQMALSHAGKGARNNKLAWKGFWSYNKLTDDWGEFGLKNDRAYYWSRVRSYGSGD